MLDERIKSLLDSELEADNLLGWEMIEAKQIPFKDVMDYVENSKVATMWEKRYRWDGTKFIRNKHLGTSIVQNSYPGYYVGTGVSGNIVYTDSSTAYSSQYLKDDKYEIQKEKRLDKPRGLWQNIKSAFKSK